MAPPTGTEQLIRDYLNRLSVAARDLAPDDRRALLERTRSLIEQKADLPRRPSTMDVGRVLARLGDPARLVEQERRRLAAHGKSPRAAPSAASVPPASSARQRFLGRALGREHSRMRGASLRWPPQPDGRYSPPLGPSNGVANGIHPPEAPAESDSKEAGAVSADPPPVPEPRAEPPAPEAANGTVHVTAAPPDAESPQPPPPPFVVAPDDGDESGADQQAAAAASPAPGIDSDGSTGAPMDKPASSQTLPADDDGTAADTAAGPPRRARAWEPPAGRWPRLGAGALRGPVRPQIGRLLAWARKRPLEAAAIVLMGIGAPIFPPVFLIGATLALASELWDGRDKWVGLALPVVLTIIGMAIGVAAGGRAHWMHEGWVYLDVVSRIAPVLGAAYLAWRSQQPRRPSAVPPFSRPRRVS